MIHKIDKELSLEDNNLPSENDSLSKLQKFLDSNIRIVKNVGWIVGGIGIVIIIQRTYAFHHFSHHSKIPEKYFQNNATLLGKVLKVNRDGSVGIQHFPLLWKSRLKYLSEPSSTLLNINITGVEFREGGIEYLTTTVKESNVKFQLLGKDKGQHIESILYLKKGWFRHICINEDLIRCGFGVASHVETLSHVKAYNKLIEKLVKIELKAVKTKAGIWKQSDADYGILYRTWLWFKSKLFRT